MYRISNPLLTFIPSTSLGIILLLVYFGPSGVVVAVGVKHEHGNIHDIHVCSNKESLAINEKTSHGSIS